MKVAIVGAGAMGSLFGALLAEAGHEVWLLDNRKEHLAAIAADGLRIDYENRARLVSLKTTFRSQEIGPSDVALVFVKSYHTEAVAGAASAIAGANGVVMTLQNGLGNAEALAACMPQNRIIAGTTSHGATLLGPGHIRHAGAGPTVIGNWDGEDMTTVKAIAAEFCKAGIECRAVADVRSVIWEKLLVNVGINAITALTGIRNGQLLDMGVTRDLSRSAVEEAMAVAKAKGIKLREDMAAHVFKVAGATAANRSSMGQDVDNHRMTEISAINGMVVTVGNRLSIPTPVNQTLTALIETLQGHYL
jgi:2-dehydropantoate 2-reductase